MAGVRTTPVLRAPHAFDLLGLRWRGGGADPHVAVRVQRASGRWSRWGEIPPAEDASADPRANAGVSGPLWTGRAVRYQLRARAFPRGLRVHFVTVPRTRLARTAQAAPGERPEIVPRSAWDPTNACPPRAAPRYGRVDFSVVHHTESLTSYSRAGAAAMVLAICRFHRNGNGWLDIGYNLLVDRFGTVYEGRAGGVEQPVIGAQAGGWNSVSTGVAVIGSFSSRPPPAAAQEALTRVLAWKLSLAGVPATGTIARTSSGGDENRWPSGTNVRFARVSGHRDADSTDCPGGALYALLPRLRAEVAARLPAPADLLTNSPFGGPLPQGGPAYLTGRLALADGRRPAGVRLSLQRRTNETTDWTEIGTLRTAADGVWSATVPVSVDGSFRVVGEQLGLASPTARVQVAAGVSLRLSPQLLRPGRTVRLSGATRPAKARVTVVVERQLPSSQRWTRVRRLTLDAVAGRYETVLPLAAAGTYRFVTSVPADGDNAAGTGPVRTAKVLPARSR
ncbi:N-acetylmuramoyl-L-alanine amidase [Conexibacter sp. CPCC 206217]|nr:N-acetylmuramoyl-L-alanine amidase [Conexibacter sp. CPCC 206217]